ncbi:hypothetical protein Ciccas_003495 [Cichlidogyrus casuarinus]|uniref:Uncharacterized protein n=1 Tax=Cichlidogyrus casuarinus TaxID=1844966 RepID=A0ABD2QE75_9PLAT
MLIVSNQLQRWLLAWICFSVVWTLGRIIENIQTCQGAKSTAREIRQSILTWMPLIITWLILSAYAEVNAETEYLIRAVFPQDGSRMLFLRLAMPNKSTQPLQVGFFDTPLTYWLIVTTMLVLLIALMARTLWEEIN